jgi:hypothetical protein
MHENAMSHFSLQRGLDNFECVNHTNSNNTTLAKLTGSAITSGRIFSLPPCRRPKCQRIAIGPETQKNGGFIFEWATQNNRIINIFWVS